MQSSKKEVVEQIVKLPFYMILFNKIAEPRVVRILQFVIYVSIFWAGVLVLMHRPENFLKVLGSDLIQLYALFIIAGSFIGAIAVLPGIWWLERVGIILLTTCVAVYIVIVFNIGVSPITVAFMIAFAISLVQRWIDIRGAQLAPREV